MIKRKTTKKSQINIKLSQKDYDEIQALSQTLGCSMAEVMREAWTYYRNQNSAAEELSQTENRLKEAAFDFITVALNLKDDEIVDTRNRCFKHFQPPRRAN